MSGSTGNIQGELKRHEKELQRDVYLTTENIAREGHPPLDMGAPAFEQRARDIEAEVKAAHRQTEEESSLNEKRALYEQAKAHLDQEGAAMMERLATFV